MKLNFNQKERDLARDTIDLLDEWARAVPLRIHELLRHADT